MTIAAGPSGLAATAGTPVLTHLVTVRASSQPPEQSQPPGPDLLRIGHFRASRSRGERHEEPGEVRIGASQIPFDSAQCPPTPAQVDHGLRICAVDSGEPLAAKDGMTDHDILLACELLLSLRRLRITQCRR
jgi:hypothetical protein